MRWLATVWVEFFRAPLLLLIFFSSRAPDLDVRFSPFWALVIALTLYNGAVLGEIFRAGILSLDRGQSEAAMPSASPTARRWPRSSCRRRPGAWIPRS